MKCKCKNLLVDPSILPAMQFPDRMIWTSSSLKMFRKCKRKFFWKYIARISPRYSSSPLIIGKAFHAALAEWYQYKRRPMLRIAESFQKIAEEQINNCQDYYDQDEFDKAIAIVDTLVGMLMGYSEIYSAEKKEWVIPKKHIEARFSVPFKDFDYQGSVDCIPHIGKHWSVVEHKTAAKLGDSYLERLPMDTQVRGYIYGAKYGLKIPVTHVVYDVVKKCKLRRKKSESSRQFGERIKLDFMSRPDFYFMREDLIFNNSDLAAFERDLMSTHDELKYVLSKCSSPLPNEWVGNDACCYEFFRNCEYLPACLDGIAGDNLDLYKCRTSLHEELVEGND